MEYPEVSPVPCLSLLAGGRAATSLLFACVISYRNASERSAED